MFRCETHSAPTELEMYVLRGAINISLLTELTAARSRSATKRGLLCLISNLRSKGVNSFPAAGNESPLP